MAQLVKSGSCRVRNAWSNHESTTDSTAHPCKVLSWHVEIQWCTCQALESAMTGLARTPRDFPGPNSEKRQTESVEVLVVFSWKIWDSVKKFFHVKGGLLTKSCTHAVAPPHLDDHTQLDWETFQIWWATIKDSSSQALSIEKPEKTKLRNLGIH